MRRLSFSRSRILFYWALSIGCFLLQTTVAAQPVESDDKPLRRKISAYISEMYAYYPGRFEIRWPQRAIRWRTPTQTDSLVVSYTRNHLPRGAVSIRVEAMQGGQVVQRMNYPLEVRVFRRVAILTRSVNGQEQVTPREIKWAERDVTQLQGDIISSYSEIEKLSTRHFLKKGTVLVKRIFITPKLMTRGALVTLLYQENNITIKMPVTALQSGAQNEVIWFMYAATHKRIRGKILSPELAVVVP